MEKQVFQKLEYCHSLKLVQKKKVFSVIILYLVKPVSIK